MLSIRGNLGQLRKCSSKPAKISRSQKHSCTKIKTTAATAAVSSKRIQQMSRAAKSRARRRVSATEHGEQSQCRQDGRADNHASTSCGAVSSSMSERSVGQGTTRKRGHQHHPRNHGTRRKATPQVQANNNNTQATDDSSHVTSTTISLTTKWTVAKHHQASTTPSATVEVAPAAALNKNNCDTTAVVNSNQVPPSATTTSDISNRTAAGPLPSALSSASSNQQQSSGSNKTKKKVVVNNNETPSPPTSTTTKASETNIIEIDLTNCDEVDDRTTEQVPESISQDEKPKKKRRPSKSRNNNNNNNINNNDDGYSYKDIPRPAAEGSSQSDAESEDPEIEELARLRCTSERTEVIAERETRRRNRRCADYPGLAFGSSIFSSDTMMKFSIIRNELHNIMNTQLKRVRTNR